MTTIQIAQRSEELFPQGLCCVESVLQAIAESRGIKSELIPKIATGLCGGIARRGGICGAVSILAINMLVELDQARQSAEVAHRLVRDFLGRFEAKFGTINCERLIGCRLDTPEGQRFFKENKLRETKCQVFVKAAAEMASAILERETQNSRLRDM